MRPWAHSLKPHWDKFPHPQIYKMGMVVCLTLLFWKGIKSNGKNCPHSLTPLLLLPFSLELTPTKLLSPQHQETSLIQVTSAFSLLGPMASSLSSSYSSDSLLEVTTHSSLKPLLCLLQGCHSLLVVLHLPRSLLLSLLFWFFPP